MLAKHLVRKGHHVTIVASSFDHFVRREAVEGHALPYTVESIDGITFLWLRTPPYAGNSGARVRNMLEFARKVWFARWTQFASTPQVVVGSSPHLFGALAAERLATRLGAAFCMEVRDLWPASLVSYGGYSPTHPYVVILGAIERWLYRRSDHIITLLPRAVEHISERGGDDTHITYVPNGADLADFHSVTHESDPGTAFTILYVGSFGLANDLETVVRAAKVLEDQGAAVTFRLVGDGPMKSHLSDLVHSLRVTSVTFEDPVPKSQVPLLLAQGDAFVASLRGINLFENGTSLNKVFDYLAAGKPIIYATPESENPVAVTGAGITTRPQDPWELAAAVRRLVSMSAEERIEMGARGQGFIRSEHDIGLLAERFEEALSSAIDRHAEKASSHRLLR